MKDALLIIDVQNDYFPGGASELHRAAEAETVIQKLLRDSRAAGRPVIYLQHFNAPEDSFFRPGTPGAEISPRIRPEPGEPVVVKYAPNGFLNTGLDEMLKALGVEKLIVCGMMTHMCVDATVRAAADRGYAVDLVADACATKDLEWNGERLCAEQVHKVFLASLNGVFAQVI